MQRALKASILVALGLFLYGRVVGGSIYFYINERFTALTLLAAVGLVLVAGSYLVLAQRADPDGNGHSRGSLSWGAFLLLALPVVFGWLVPPAPLGASALTNRQLDIGGSGGVGSVPAGGDTRLAAPADGGARNVLDWVRALHAQPDPAAFSGEEATVVGFVYRDERFAAGQFLVARYVLSCCAADAAPIGLVVQWPQEAELPVDEWVEVEGHFELQPFAGEQSAVLVAQSVTTTERPRQPYLYP